MQDKNYKIRAAVDIGGTFTDLIYFKTDTQTNETQVTVSKVDTTLNLEEGVFNVIEIGGLKYQDISALIHGTTVVINALTQKKGAKTALITSKGCRDILELGRGNRPDFFNPFY
jgi:N-methylhydantoinase A